MWKIVNLKWCWKLSLKRPKGKKKKVQAKDLAKTKSSLLFGEVRRASKNNSTKERFYVSAPRVTLGVKRRGRDYSVSQRVWPCTGEWLLTSMAFLILITNQFSYRRNARVMSRALIYKIRSRIANEFCCVCACNYKLPPTIAKWFKNLMSDARFTLGSECWHCVRWAADCRSFSYLRTMTGSRNFSKNWKNTW